MKSPKPATDTIYPHIKFWWYRTMLNFYPPFLCLVLAAILKMADILKILKTQKHISITPPSFMKFCPVVPKICRGQVHGARKERIIIIIIIRNGAKTISLQTLFGRLNKDSNSEFPQKICRWPNVLSLFYWNW